MAALLTLPQHCEYRKSVNKSGVLTLSGFGIKLRMLCGHLEIEDGVGPERRKIRLPRVGHGLKRLVCIAEDGFVTLSALKWLSDQNTAFVMLNRAGKTLFATPPAASSDIRLRRAQALAHQSGAALEITRALIAEKLNGQQQLVRIKLANPDVADVITRLRDNLSSAETMEKVVKLEAHAAARYWSAWNTIPINFPRQDVGRVPSHWYTFGTRKSILTGSPRLATNPPNAILNYCYALLENEASIAATALGLDPGMGMLHVDTPSRDSLACDLMEAVRPSVDAWVLNWIMREPLRRADFFEECNGNCRLLKTITTKLGETTTTWGKLVAPWAEYVARTLWVRKSASSQRTPMPTRLTQQHRREVRGITEGRSIKAPKVERVCRGCGKEIENGSIHCALCAVDGAKRRFVEIARIGRIAAHTPAALAKESKSQREHAKGRSLWTLSKQPAWLSPEVFSKKIQPALAKQSSSAIASHIGVSRWYAGRVREGYRPHPRHWERLAQLVGVS